MLFPFTHGVRAHSAAHVMDFTFRSLATQLKNAACRVTRLREHPRPAKDPAPPRGGRWTGKRESS